METLLSNAILDETFVWTQNQTVAKFIEPFFRLVCNPGVQTHCDLKIYCTGIRNTKGWQENDRLEYEIDRLEEPLGTEAEGNIPAYILV